MRSGEHSNCRGLHRVFHLLLGYTGIVSGEPDGQHHSKARLACSGRDLKLSPVLVDDDVVGDMQAKARAYAGILRRVEGLENARLNLLGYSWSVVDDVYRNDTLRGEGAQSEHSLTCYGVYGVVDHVGPHLIELGPVSLYARNVFGVISLDANTRGDPGTQEHQGVLQALDHIDFLDRRLIQVRVRFDGLDYLRQGFSALANLIQQAVDRRTGSQPSDYNGQLCNREAFGHPLQLIPIPAGGDQHRREFPGLPDAVVLQPLLQPILLLAEGQWLGYRRCSLALCDFFLQGAERLLLVLVGGEHVELSRQLLSLGQRIT